MKDCRTSDVSRTIPHPILIHRHRKCSWAFVYKYLTRFDIIFGISRHPYHRRRWLGNGIRRSIHPRRLYLVIEALNGLVDTGGEPLNDGKIHEGGRVYGSLVIASAGTLASGGIAASSGTNIVTSWFVSGCRVVSGGVASTVIISKETSDAGLQSSCNRGT